MMIPAGKAATTFLSMLTALPFLCTGGNLYPNPGFENWDAQKNLPTTVSWRWHFPKGGQKAFTIFEQSGREKHSGKYSLHLKDTNSGKVNHTFTYFITGNELQKYSGKILRFSAWVKQVSAGNPRDVGLGIHISRKSGKAVTAGAGTGTVGPTGWIHLKAKVRVPNDPKLVFISLNCSNGWGGTGEAYFDDVVLTTDTPVKSAELEKESVEVAPAKVKTVMPAGDTPEMTAYRKGYLEQKPAENDPRQRPVIKNGTWYFNGKPTFYVGVWLYNRSHVDWPGNVLGIDHPAYKTAPGKEIFEYMGFNSSQISAAHTLPGIAMHNLKLPKDWKLQEKLIGKFFTNFKDFPMVMDFAFGYHASFPAAKRRELDQCTGKWHQFVPFCPEHPEGDAYYRDYFLGGTRAAMRYHANTYLYELFNESSYNCQCRFNAKSFAKEMQKKYGSIENANKQWGTVFDDFNDVAAQTHFAQYRKLWPDWCKFSERRYADILKKYKALIRTADKRSNVYFTEQASGTPPPRVGMDYRLIADALDVLTLEGGWRYGYASTYQAKNEMEGVVATGGSKHFFNCDFFQALAKGEKPINDHEHYCTRIEHGIRVPSKREDMISSLWMEAMHGVSASFTYVWDKRSWQARTFEQAKKNVINPSYKSSSLLNPYNWPPDQLDAFKIFRQEFDAYKDKIMPFPRTKPATVAVFFSYPTLRMGEFAKKNYMNQVSTWYTTLLHAHYPLKVVFEQELAKGLGPEVQALIIPAAAYTEPRTIADAEAFRKKGGLVIVTPDSFQWDEYSYPLKGEKNFIRAETPEKAIEILNAKKVARYGEILPSAGEKAFTQSDIQIVDRGNFKLVMLISLATMNSREAIVKLHLADKKNADEPFYVTNVIRKQLILNGAKETWTLRELSEKGFHIILPPQERAIVTLEKKRPANVMNYSAAKMKQDLASEQKRQEPYVKKFIETRRKKIEEETESRIYRNVPAAKCRALDLKKVVNMHFKDEVAGDKKGGWFDQGTNDFSNMPLGKHTFAGVPFEIINPSKNGGKSVLVLWGSHRDFFPVEVKGIPVGMNAKNIFFLHTMGWKGNHVLTYRIHYQDGGILDIPVRGDYEIASWWGATMLPNAKIAVESYNTEKDKINMQAFRWTNPAPSKKIASLDIISQKCEALPAVAAITVEQP